MEQKELTDVLYDFLYRDDNRIASYYAQIFRGRLSLLEETDVITDTVEKSIEGSVQVAKGIRKSISSNQSGSKRIIDPHDVATIDVLTHLIDTNQVSNNIDTAPHGSLITTNGTLSLIDNKVLEMAISAFEHQIQEAKRFAKTKPEEEEVRNAELIYKVLKSVQLPSAFLLNLDDGRKVGGVIKESGMEDLISTYYFKYGAAGLPDVFLIGIKENPNQVDLLPVEQLFGASQQIAQGLNQALFPIDSIKITPLALFRRL